jgi:hypothetical protein
MRIDLTLNFLHLDRSESWGIFIDTLTSQMQNIQSLNIDLCLALLIVIITLLLQL